MKLAGDYVFEAPVAEVWSALMDPAVLAAVLPGCDKLELVEGQFVGELNIKMGPIQGKFAGKVELRDIVAPESYTMIIDGRGTPGFVKATASVKLQADGQATKLVYDADAQIGGKIATVGQRLVDASAKAITKQSLEGLHANIKVRHSAAPREPSPKERAADATHDETAPVEVTAKDNDDAPKEKAPLPVVKVDEKAFAASVAKEVTKALIPPPVLYAALFVAIAFVLWLVLR
jgi:carbon monoxide dehydrogenase subunit G